jgi:transcriptional regulator with AAA-type ATPase domain
MSQLFGHAKGAFTGAVADTAGLVAAADGGMLFLDEIHRLPPEGQEMLFYLMDQGWYRRLGETSGQRACRTMVIGATTESPQAALLASFVRRFPVKIELPPLAEWTLADRMALLVKMIADESARVAMPVRISAECIAPSSSTTAPATSASSGTTSNSPAPAPSSPAGAAPARPAA